MYVKVGRHTVDVVVEGLPANESGDPVEAVFRPGPMQIALSPDIPHDDRRSKLRDALMQAYDYSYGKVADDDEAGQVKRLSDIDSGLQADIVIQHGDGVLHVLFGEEVDATADDGPSDFARIPFGDEDTGTTWPTDVACPVCGDVMTNEQVVNGEPHYDINADGFAMVRRLSCPSCRRTATWTSRCSYDGQPWPKKLKGPMIFREPLDGGGDGAAAPAPQV